MNKNELVKFCIINDDAVADYPWANKKTYNDVAVIRNKNNKKWFALVFELDKKLYLNLKCDPQDSWILQDQYDFITPAWHMNKKHWIKVEVKKASKNLLKTLITNSFNLVS
jgi:predicted DNA-binding protein (MmcQ/YjbR family)